MPFSQTGFTARFYEGISPGWWMAALYNEWRIILTQIKRFKKLLIFSGLFNIVLAFPLIIPTFFKSYIDFLYYLNELIGLGGVRPVLPKDGLSQLLINTAGGDLVLIGSIVLVSSIDPIKFRLIPLLNAIGRTLFAILIATNIYHWTIMVGYWMKLQTKYAHQQDLKTKIQFQRTKFPHCYGCANVADNQRLMLLNGIVHVVSVLKLSQKII